jgi:hypothetical protein
LLDHRRCVVPDRAGADLNASLAPHARHGCETAARQSIQQAADAVDLLDALEADATRRASALASISALIEDKRTTRDALPVNE